MKYGKSVLERLADSENKKYRSEHGRCFAMGLGVSSLSYVFISDIYMQNNTNSQNLILSVNHKNAICTQYNLQISNCTSVKYDKYQVRAFF